MGAERRLNTRVNTDLYAQAAKDSDPFSVQVVNLSISGFQVEGGEELVSLKAEGVHGAIELSLEFQLAGQSVSSLCRVVYKRRMSASRAALGLKIINMDDNTRAAIENYVQSRL